MSLCQSLQSFEARRLRIALSTAPEVLSQSHLQVCLDRALRPKQTSRRSRLMRRSQPDTDVCVPRLEVSLPGSRLEQVGPMLQRVWRVLALHQYIWSRRQFLELSVRWPPTLLPAVAPLG